MHKTSAVIALVVATLLPGGVMAQEAKAVVERAIQAAGSAGLTSLTYSGLAANANFGQSRTISAAQANPSQLMTAAAGVTPGAGRGGGAPQTPPAVASEKLAEGVYRITGGMSRSRSSSRSGAPIAGAGEAVVRLVEF